MCLDMCLPDNKGPTVRIAGGVLIMSQEGWEQSSEHGRGDAHLLLLPTGAQTLDTSSGTPSTAGTWPPYASHSTA